MILLNWSNSSFDNDGQRRLSGNTSDTINSGDLVVPLKERVLMGDMNAIAEEDPHII